MTPWERSLRLALALHDLALAGHELTGNTARIETARLEVVAAIDRATAAGVPEKEIDAALSRSESERP